MKVRGRVGRMSRRAGMEFRTLETSGPDVGKVAGEGARGREGEGGMEGRRRNR